MTRKHCELVDITAEVQQAVANSGTREGICMVYASGLPNAIVITNAQNSSGHLDIAEDLERIFPARDNFHFNGPAATGSAHSKAAIVGNTREFSIRDNTLLLGSREGIFLAAFDGLECSSYKIKIFPA